MMRLILMLFALVALCAALTGSVSAADEGLAMLKNDYAARPAGMGAAFVSMAGDVNATAYNPASAVGVDKFTASFGHTFFWERIRLESGYFAAPLIARLHVHGGIRFAVIDQLEARVYPTLEPDALFDAHDVSFKGGLAYLVTERVSVGVAAGWVIEKIEAWRGSAFNVDLGLMAKPARNVTIGASVTNMGADFYLEKRGLRGSRDIALPTTYRVGGSYRYQKYLGALDLVVLDDLVHLHLGAEARLHPQLAVRAGYMTNYDSKNFTAGASFIRGKLAVDYAFIPFTDNLGSSHMFNLTVSL